MLLFYPITIIIIIIITIIIIVIIVLLHGYMVTTYTWLSPYTRWTPYYTT